MTIFTANQARKAGAIIPGGMKRIGAVAVVLKNVFNNQQLTLAMGGALPEVRQTAKNGVGGRCSLVRSLGGVIAEVAVSTLKQVGGPGASHTNINRWQTTKK